MVVCGIIFTRFVGHRRLREAVTRLAADGLIVLSPRRGYAVTSLLRISTRGVIAASGRNHLARFAGLLLDTVEAYIRVEVNMTGDVEEAQRDHRQLFVGPCWATSRYIGSVRISRSLS